MAKWKQIFNNVCFFLYTLLLLTVGFSKVHYVIILYIFKHTSRAGKVYHLVNVLADKPRWLTSIAGTLIVEEKKWLPRCSPTFPHMFIHRRNQPVVEMELNLHQSSSQGNLCIKKGNNNKNSQMLYAPPHVQIPTSIKYAYKGGRRYE